MTKGGGGKNTYRKRREVDGEPGKYNKRIERKKNKYNKCKRSRRDKRKCDKSRMREINVIKEDRLKYCKRTRRNMIKDGGKQR